MTEIKLTKRYPQSRAEDITDAFMRGYEQGKKDGLKVGKQIVLGAFETYINADRKTEPQKIGYCNECKWFRVKQVCGRCRSRNLYAPKTEPQTCEECEHWNDTEDGCADRHGCKTEPNSSEKPNNCEYAENPSGDVWECGCFLDTYCEHQIYDRNPDETINIVECGYEPKTEPQTCSTCKFDHEKWFEAECDSCCDAHSNWKPKDEPQTETSTNSEKVQLKVQLTDEPQTERLCDKCEYYKPSEICGHPSIGEVEMDGKGDTFPWIKETPEWCPLKPQTERSE